MRASVALMSVSSAVTWTWLVAIPAAGTYPRRMRQATAMALLPEAHAACGNAHLVGRLNGVTSNAIGMLCCRPIMCRSCERQGVLRDARTPSDASEGILDPAGAILVSITSVHS
jgi:hypothetical protein